MALGTQTASMSDFSDMDTGVYWDEARKYLPDKIRFLFITESPPAFQDENRMTFFYFLDSYSDALFRNLMKAVFDVDYRKDKERKQALLERFREEGFYLINSLFKDLCEMYNVLNDGYIAFPRAKKSQAIFNVKVRELLNRGAA